jgi:hypothetical protein
MASPHPEATVSRHTIVAIDPLLGADGAASMVTLCERFASYRMYSEENVDVDLGRELPQRYDAVANFLRTGGMRGGDEPVAVLAARTNYFRDEYAYGDDVRIAGIEPFLHHEAFVEGARQVHGRKVVEPAIVYANLMVPGQELALHTDVPEFRGCNRKGMPQWLLVVMHHSGLFDDHRMPIATGVAWFHDCAGGEFVHYPDGRDGARATFPVHHDSALVLDTDSVFHGVDRVSDARVPLAPLRPGMTLDFAGDATWAVHDGVVEVARYSWSDLRFSVSWKAYCFEDEHERATWREHRDDLTLTGVVDRLVSDLRERGRVGERRPSDAELPVLLIDEYVRFPAPLRA